MAIKEVVVRTRPNTSVNFSAPNENGLPNNWGSLELASGELISFDESFSADGLTKTVTTIFKDEEARTNYNNNSTYRSAMNTVKAEDVNNNITKTVTITEV
jgi:hypothetical protein